MAVVLFDIDLSTVFFFHRLDTPGYVRVSPFFPTQCLCSLPCLSKKNCLPFSQNFPAGKAYRLLESILATKYSRHKLFVHRTRTFNDRSAFNKGSSFS